jgi:hypothetical protein
MHTGERMAVKAANRRTARPNSRMLLHLIDAKNEKARNTEWNREHQKRREETHAEEAEGRNRPKRARRPDETDAVEKLHTRKAAYLLLDGVLCVL